MGDSETGCGRMSIRNFRPSAVGSREPVVPMFPTLNSGCGVPGRSGIDFHRHDAAAVRLHGIEFPAVASPLRLGDATTRALTAASLFDYYGRRRMSYLISRTTGTAFVRKSLRGFVAYWVAQAKQRKRRR